jgi:phosphatidate phosphatase APP1
MVRCAEAEPRAGHAVPDAMSVFKRFLHSLLAGAERDIDSVEDLLSRGEGHNRKVRLLAYAGYRSANLVRLKGRVVRYEKPLDAGEGFVTRVRAMAEIYNSHELPGVLVRCEGYGKAVEVETDEEGYFHFEFATDQQLPPSTLWEQVAISTPGREAQQPVIRVPIIAPGRDNHWGIISDIDDTVVETGATDFLKNWRRVLVDRPQDRLAVPGASTLYKTIALDHRAPARPFFYVSSSPWNLYGFIAEFMELNAIPHGPMFLKDYGVDEKHLIGKSHDEHKLVAIETILAFYPNMRFLLIGDNGQRDVSIYHKVVKDFGTRVGAVFIRDVDGSCRSGPEGQLLLDIEALGVPTFCGAGFDEAVDVVQTLQLDRPLEAASAALTPDLAGQVS